jgi:hypothetical protein
MKGSRANPFELRPGATDRFYVILGAGWLDTGDTIASADWTCPSSGITIAGETINVAPLQLDGVSYAAGEVASAQLSGVTANDLVEVVCTVTTNAARIDPRSIWIKGVHNYSSE